MYFWSSRAFTDTQKLTRFQLHDVEHQAGEAPSWAENVISTILNISLKLYIMGFKYLSGKFERNILCNVVGTCSGVGVINYILFTFEGYPVNMNERFKN